jgi:hypothetical protein
MYICIYICTHTYHIYAYIHVIMSVQDDSSSRSFLLQHLRGEDHVVVVTVQAGLGFHAESTCVAAWYVSLSLSLSLCGWVGVTWRQALAEAGGQHGVKFKAAAAASSSTGESRDDWSSDESG